MNKYYKPDIEEFHVGFEYEHNVHSRGKWKKKVGWQSIHYLMGQIQAGEIRVKYLDREDIESLGFHKTGQDVDELTFQYHVNDHNWYELIWNWDEDKLENWNVCIERWYNSELNPSGYQVLFRGTVKNKSELKRILKQVGAYEVDNSEFSQ